MGNRFVRSAKIGFALWIFLIALLYILNYSPSVDNILRNIPVIGEIVGFMILLLVFLPGIFAGVFGFSFEDGGGSMFGGISPDTTSGFIVGYIGLAITFLLIGMMLSWVFDFLTFNNSSVKIEKLPL